MIYYIIGIRRSGLHAIANWLFPMMGEYIYLNNYELGKLQENELVVNGNFNVIIGLENKPVDEVLKYTNNGKRIWVWRNPDEVLESQSSWYFKNSPEVLVEKIDEAKRLIEQYEGHITKILKHKTSDRVIFYHHWNTYKYYRRHEADMLNLQFNDSNKEKIFGYGKSSFAK